MGSLRILCVHGLGDHRQKPWREEWEAAVRAAFPAAGVDLEFEFLTYDPVFEGVHLSAGETVVALGKLLRSGATSIFGGSRALSEGARGGARGFDDVVRWTAGYVVAWVEDAEFRRKTRRLVLDAIDATQPDVVLAHSLGTLVTFDALLHRDARATPARTAAVRKLHYVTFGSQIGNPFVRGNLVSGRVTMPPVARWTHLYNEEDDVFTAPIRLPGEPAFRQVDAYFDIDGFADHDATTYLSHRNTRAFLWEPLAESAAGTTPAGGRAFRAPFAAAPEKPRAPRHRALLVGINEYPNEGDRLAGCVNDVFLMSEALQECGFPAKDIRLCLDRRATARGILERLEWLVDDPRPEDSLFFFYSGHGAQLPTYGAGDRADRMDETLVPWDFDWSPETSVTDDRIFDLYSQLPYGTRLVMAFDCCHSGGIHRAGAPRARGLEPPDDIRHRGMRWDPATRTWDQRDLADLAAGFSDDEETSRRFFGEAGKTARLGRAAALRRTNAKEYEAEVKSAGGPVGPYLPVILEACREAELAYEYRHGATSYGAFTYSVVSALRRRRHPTFARVVESASRTIRKMGYSQHPQILGPRAVVTAEVPWMKKPVRPA